MSIKKLARQTVLPVVLLIVYAVPTTILDLIYLPSPQEIAVALFDWVTNRWQADIVPSLRNLALGFGLGTFFGAALGLALGMVPWLRETFEPLATFLRGIPPIALIPIFMLAMGVDDSMRIAVIATGAFFPVLVNAIDGAAQLDHTLRDMARVHHVRLHHYVKDIVLPGALPQILAGAKVSLTIAIILIFTSELRGASEGIGAFILQSDRFFAMAPLWAGTFFLGLLGFALMRMFAAVEGRLLAWRQ